jgi:hypothetical protein
MSTKKLQILESLVPFPDATLSVHGSPADAKATGDAINNKADHIPITNKDNGKYMRVDGGKWVVEDGNVVTALKDKESLEGIYQAYEEDRAVYTIIDGRTLWLKSMEVDSYELPTKAIFADDDGTIEVGAADTWNNGGSWKHGEVVLGGSAYKITSKEFTPTSNYYAQLEFKFSGNNIIDAVTSDERDEGFYILPLNDSTNPNIPFNEARKRYWKYKIRLSKRSGVQLIYDVNSNGDYSGALAEQAFTFTHDTYYTVKVAKVNNTLSAKVWLSSEEEPTDWSITYTDANTITAQDSQGFECHFTNKNDDGETVTVKNMVFSADDAEQEYSLSGTDVWSKFKIDSRAVPVGTGYRLNGTTSTIISNERLSGDYSVSFNFTFENSYASSEDRDEGLFIMPLAKSSNPLYENGKNLKIRLSDTDGVQLIHNDTINGDYGGVIAGKRRADGGSDNLPQTLSRGVTYSFYIDKKNDTISLSMRESALADLIFSYSYTDPIIDHTSDYDEANLNNWNFIIYGTNKGSDTETILIDNLVISGRKKRTFFWDNSLDNRSKLNASFTTGGSIWGDYVESEKETYTHPTTSGYKHIPSGGSVYEVLAGTSDGDGSARWSRLEADFIGGGIFNGAVMARNNSTIGCNVRNTALVSYTTTVSDLTEYVRFDGDILWTYE